MIESFFLSALLFTLQSASPERPQAPETQASVREERALSDEENATLRCSAAFALIGARQARSDAETSWPNIEERGREFFVQALASIMDTHGLDRPQIEAQVRREAQRLIDADEVDKVMPACLLMLQASGL
ncbi:MAG: hypothetical protein AAGH57_10115 [Pseudomonadota bacterium]